MISSLSPVSDDRRENKGAKVNGFVDEGRGRKQKKEEGDKDWIDAKSEEL